MAIDVALSRSRSSATLLDFTRERPAVVAAPAPSVRVGRGFASHRRPGASVLGGALVIGGPATQQRFCATFLETLGVQVTVARSFHDGVRSLAQAAHRVIILDAHTKDFDAAGWARILDDVAVRPKIFVIVDDLELAGQGAASRLRADGVIRRPIRALDLVKIAELAGR